jgi:hypothetical protein
LTGFIQPFFLPLDFGQPPKFLGKRDFLGKAGAAAE